jgi:hypothetical protein
MKKDQRQQQLRRAAVVTIVVGLIFIVTLGIVTHSLCGATDGMERVSCVRDMAIIIVMLESMIALLLLAVVAVVSTMLAQTIATDLMPILESARQTAATVETTTSFVGETVVTPIIRVHQMVSGTKGFFAALFGKEKTQGGKDKNEQR